MSLIICKECKQEISSDAKVCPHCGKRLKLSGCVFTLIVIVSFWIICIAIIIVVNVFNASSTNVNSQMPQTTEQIDTSGNFIASILNCSPKEVAKQLGEPDYKIKPSNNCGYLPSCNETNYQNGKYEAFYYKNKLKSLTINQKGLVNKNAICYIGFPNCVPTFSNPPKYIGWRNSEEKGTAIGPIIPIKGIREIFAWPDFMVIEVEANFDKKFEKFNKQTRDNANAETQKQEIVEAEKSALHKKMIEVQFSSWDGSHISLTKEIKKAMNYPESYEHISTTCTDLGDHIQVWTEFRGKNSFGAKVENIVNAKIGLDGHIIEMEFVK